MKNNIDFTYMNYYITIDEDHFYQLDLNDNLFKYYTEILEWPLIFKIEDNNLTYFVTIYNN